MKSGGGEGTKEVVTATRRQRWRESGEQEGGIKGWREEEREEEREVADIWRREEEPRMGKVNWYEWDFRQGWMKWNWRREERGRGRQEFVDEWEQEREGEGEQKVWVVAAKCV